MLVTFDPCDEPLVIFNTYSRLGYTGILHDQCAVKILKGQNKGQMMMMMMMMISDLEDVSFFCADLARDTND